MTLSPRIAIPIMIRCGCSTYLCGYHRSGLLASPNYIERWSARLSLMYHGSRELYYSPFRSQHSSVPPYAARVIVALAPPRSVGCLSLNGLDSPYWDCRDRPFVPSSRQSGSRTKGPRGGIIYGVPLTAPPTAFSHRSLCGSNQSPCEYISSGSVSVSSSVGSHSNL